MASIGRIPDFSSAPLYATVVLDTRDDPRLLALWCNLAIWRPIDRALDQPANLATWAERTGFAPEEIRALITTLIERTLLEPDTSISWWTLEQASREAVLPYSNELRWREGIRPLVLSQPSLLLE
ncbi:hypothetical protein K2Z83_22750 [Oscillochloris sp. ZM17-4]|uniref:hypothetical protein n=1 Tax=Oscillochloris sp. ZM17-4 TaxID=2866714 RepID=UPI001C7378B8|nr:hypothetical protein [Oscillochloris sp. ZM17-4]MBX0330478.1 hypothetical protein [Oscillochloris sp. ZM17-4]